jgi:DNA gyrase/topoisomerase IV subunit B
MNNKTIIALSDFEHVLARPTMYIGSIDPSEEKVSIIRDGKLINDIKEISVGFYKLMIEILDNAFDEAKRQKGALKTIEIHFKSSDNSVRVVDTGGGFINASSPNPKTRVSNVQTAMTMLRAGSNFNNENVAEHLIGTNGVGASVVNMLSDEFFIRTINDHEIYEQTWKKFMSKGPLVKERTDEATGTEIFYIPRKDKFKGCKWEKDYIHTLMVFKQFLMKNDPDIEKLEFICTFDGQSLDLNTQFLPEEIVKVENKYGTFLLWESYQNGASVSFVNGAQCTGIHQRILLDHVNAVYENPLAGRFYESMIILNLPPKYVRFGDQNKTRFVTSRTELSPVLEKSFFPGIRKELKTSPIYDNILKKIAEAEKDTDMRNLKNKKRVQKSKISDKYFPPSGKTKNLFIVEGGSAMGSILQKRDPKQDAVYALKGKVKNARRVSDLTSNGEIIDLMNILGIEPDNDRNCKYERVVISTDADPDGLGHIASLIINLFHRWFPNVIRQGKLFILQTPLLSVDENKKKKYFFSMKEFENYAKIKKPASVRYLKGLGSLSREDWESVFSNMRLLKVTEDSKSDKMIDMAFGSNAGLRKKWLQS